MTSTQLFAHLKLYPEVYRVTALPLHSPEATVTSTQLFAHLKPYPEVYRVTALYAAVCSPEALS